MLNISFSPAPECVDAECWTQVFPTPHNGSNNEVIVVLVVVVVIVLSRSLYIWQRPVS